MKSIIYRHKLPFPWSQFQYIFSSKFNNIAHIWYYLPVLMSSEPLFLSRNTWFYSWRFLLKSAGNGLKGLGCAAAAMSHNVSKHQLCVWKTVGFQILKCQSIDAPLGIVSFVWSRQPTLLSAYQFNWYLFLRYLQYLPFPTLKWLSLWNSFLGWRFLFCIQWKNALAFNWIWMSRPHHVIYYAWPHTLLPRAWRERLYPSKDVAMLSLLCWGNWLNFVVMLFIAETSEPPGNE